ncbi:GGDEF domain-containing protein [Sphingosinicellaceae bacterium]|nr:GGDEF domain-containing protein [Sphingosinicellaceae bacterium]
MQAGPENGPAIRQRITSELHQAVPIFGGGGISTVAVAVTLAQQLGHPLLVAWAASEALLMAARLVLTWLGRRPARTGLPWTPKGLLILEIAGAASVGFGTTAAILTGQWMGIVIGWMSATAFAGETCVRNLGTLRLVTTMLCLGAAPPIAACLFTGVPLLQIAGVLTAVYTARMIFSATRLSSVLVDTMRAERENDHRARHDKLTGLLNRAGLEREIELMRNDHPRTNLTLFFIDLDSFKLVNDTHGHDTGDQLLRAVAEQLLELVGARDIVARIGGDEFVVVTALKLVEPTEFGRAILSAINSAQHEVSLSRTTVTASIGVAQTTVDGSELADLMKAADLQLYHAKHAGGSRCMVADIDAA